MADKLNPKIQKLEIGIKTLREIPVYPLSIKDQTDMGAIVVEAVSSVLAEVSGGKVATEVFVKSIYLAIESNLPKIAVIVTGEPDVLAEMDMDQLIELSDIIFEQNFAGAVKKMPDIKKKWASVFAIKEKVEVPKKELSTTK